MVSLEHGFYGLTQIFTDFFFLFLCKAQAFMPVKCQIYPH